MSRHLESKSIFAASTGPASESLLSRDCERPRSLARAQMDRMKWDTPDNTCTSLRVLAELVRSGALDWDVSKPQDELLIGFRERTR